MTNIKKFVLLIQELIEVSLLSFYVMSQVLFINTNNHCTESKLQEIKLNGSNKLEVVFLSFFLSFFYYHW